MFVFINIFRQSTHLKSVNKRLVYTIRTAGVATFYTSFTTAMAFASNIASSVSEPSAAHFSHAQKENQYMHNDQCLAGHLSVSSMAKTAVLAFLFIVVVSHFQTAQPFVLRWILWTLYLLTCQATVTVGDSHLCCRVCVQSYMRSLCCH